MAYADCSIIALTNGDPRLCDCNKIIDTDTIPVSTPQPDKQKDLSLKADWKYLGETVFSFAETQSSHTTVKVSARRYVASGGFTGSVFHPPRA